MRLKQVLLEENEFEKGLKAIDMRNLGQVVALFGPNGAGKTRLLHCVDAYVSRSMRAIGKAGEKTLAHLERNATNIKGKLSHLEGRVVKHKTYGLIFGRSEEQLDADVERLSKH
jgi:ABC-type phosphate/phosphonate transport system ATPase subunit